MNRIARFMPAIVLVLGVASSVVLPVSGVRTSRAEDRTQAVRIAGGEREVESEWDEVEAPRMADRADEVQAPRADEVQAPREDGLQAPRGGEDRQEQVEAPRGA